MSRRLVLLLSILPLAAAAADPVGHYHPDDVAAASQVFAQAADAVGPRYSEAEGKLSKVSRSLEALETGVFLLGERAPDGLAAWLLDARRQATGEFLRLQRHVDLMGEDYSTEFGAAFERAVSTAGAGLVECGASGVAALVGGKNCPGDDRNAALAAVIDKDPKLAKAVAEINAVPWPEVSTPQKQWPVVPLTGTKTWVRADTLLTKLAPERLQVHQDNLDRKLAPLDEAISSGDADAIETAKGLRDAYAAALAKDGAVLLAAAKASLEKGAKKGKAPAEVGVCANPSALGGCPGEDATKAVLRFLRDDKRFNAAVSGLR